METLKYEIVFKWFRRYYSNLRPSDPKALNNPSKALFLQAMTK